MRKATRIRPCNDGTCEVELSSGLVARIDECDAEKVSLFSWFCSSTHCSRTFYARGRMQGVRGAGWYMHRVILCFPVMSVDHINGNGLDNRRCNLRLATHAQNCRNLQGRNVKKTSQYKGVHASHGKWAAQIRYNRKLLNIGWFEDERIAAGAYDVASKRLHGEFGLTNLSRSLLPASVESLVHGRIDKFLGLSVREVASCPQH